MSDLVDKTQLGGLAGSIDALFSRATAAPGADAGTLDAGVATRAMVEAGRNPQYDAAPRQRTLLTTVVVLAVLFFAVVVGEITQHDEHVAQFNTRATRRNVATAFVLAVAFVTTFRMWLRGRPKARPLFTLDDIREGAPD